MLAYNDNGTLIEVGGKTTSLYGVCNTAANIAAKTVSVDSFASLQVGTTIRVKFTNGNTAPSPTLQVNSTGAKPIYVKGTTAPGTTEFDSWDAGAVVEFAYDGTGWLMLSGGLNSHRPIEVDDVQLLGNNAEALNIQSGSNINLTAASGNVRISQTYSQSKLYYSVPVGSWSASPNASGYYTQSISITDRAVNTLYSPNIYVAGATESTFPTDAESAQFELIDEVTLTTVSDVPTVTLYAKTKPTSSFHIYVECMSDATMSDLPTGSNIRNDVDAIEGNLEDLEDEIADARITAFGTTAASLGEAVRGQVTKLEDFTNIKIWNGIKGDVSNTGYRYTNTNPGRIQSNNTWTNIASGAHHFIIPVKEGDIVYVKANASKFAIIAVLRSYPLILRTGDSADYSTASGYTGAISISAGNTGTYTMPSDAQYLYILSDYSTDDYTPAELKINGSDLYTGTRILLNQVSDKISKVSDEVSKVIDDIVVHESSASYSNGLNNSNVFVLNQVIPKNSNAVLNIVGVSGKVGQTTVYYFKKNNNSTLTVLDSTTLNSLNIGNNIVSIPDTVRATSFYIGFYSESVGIGYQTTGSTNEYKRFSYANISDPQITLNSGVVNLNFAFSLSYMKNHLTTNNYVVVDITGGGDYTSLVDAMTNEPENTIIYVNPGIYEQDMEACLRKRVVVIGADRNQCIIRCTDGRYMHHPLYVCCGYFDNLTIESKYISGVSQEIDINTRGSYAVHIDTDGDYSVGKQLEFHHCNIISDFFPAIGCGLRKDMTLIIDDCELVNNQILNRGMYSDIGTYGALFVHDSNGVQGAQYLKIKDCVLRSKLQYCMCLQQVNRSPQNNEVYCEFINTVLYSESNGYANTCLLNNDPFNPSTGIFTRVIGYGNSIAVLNNFPTS